MLYNTRVRVSIMVADGATTILEDVKISKCRLTSPEPLVAKGGGIFVGAGQLTMLGGSIEDCDATTDVFETLGGALYVQGTGMRNCAPSIYTPCTLSPGVWRR